MFVETEYVREKLLFHAFAPLVMGTKFDLLTVGQSRENSAKMWKIIMEQLESWQSMLNRFDPESELSRCNAGLSAMSEELSYIKDQAMRYTPRTCGLFNIEHDGDGQMDFGGFAKGMSLKFIKVCLDEYAVQQAFVDFGGSSVLALGEHPCGSPWQMRLTDPFSGKALHTLDLASGVALSVSGNSPGYVGHVVNPLTGKKYEGKKLAVVMSADPLDAEVLSTVLMVADESQRQEIEKDFPDARMDIIE